MMLALQNYCEYNSQPVSKDDIQINQHYAGLSSDGYWYR